MDSNTLKVKMGEAGKYFTVLAAHMNIMLKDGCYSPEAASVLFCEGRARLCSEEASLTRISFSWGKLHDFHPSNL